MADFTREEIEALAVQYEDVSTFFSPADDLIATALRALAKSMDAEPVGFVSPLARAELAAGRDGFIFPTAHHTFIIPLYDAPPASASAEPVAIKDLVVTSAGAGRWSAWPYSIWHQWAGDGRFHASIQVDRHKDDLIGEPGFKSLEEAAAAINAHNKARIRSALAEAPSPAVAAVPANDPYDRGRRDMLNAILELNPAIGAKLAAFSGRDADPHGRLPFDVVLWVTEVATQLGIEPKDDPAAPSQPASQNGEDR